MVFVDCHLQLALVAVDSAEIGVERGRLRIKPDRRLALDDCDLQLVLFIINVAETRAAGISPAAALLNGDQRKL